MNCLKSSAILKAEVRDRLLGQYIPLISGFFIMQFVLYLISLVAGNLLPGHSLWEEVLFYTVAVLSQLIAGIFQIGQARLYMNFLSDREVRPGIIFSAFRTQAGVGIIITLVRLAISAVCMAPFLGCLFIYMSSKDVSMLILAILLGIAGLVPAVYILLLYSQCYYLAVDYPEYTAGQILQMSKRVMEGHRKQLLYLYLSFIPMMLACIVSFGLGMIWLYPYMQGTLCNFYFDLMEFQTRNVQSNNA